MNDHTETLPSPIFIISGVPGAGKSTIARALLQRFKYGFYLPLDDLREWVIKGRADPVPERTKETTRQFRLAFEAGAQIARTYADAGFVEAIDQVLWPHDVNEFLVPEFSNHSLYKVILLPGKEIALCRNVSRTNKNFDTQVLAEPISKMYPELENEVMQDSGWVLIDNSKMNIEQVVDEILRQCKI